MPQTLEAIMYRGDNQERIDYTPGSAVANGVIVAVGTPPLGMVGVVTSPEGLAASVKGSLATFGTYKVKSATATTFAQGAEVFWDTVNRVAVTAAGANIIRIGIAEEAKVNGDDHVKTAINRRAGTATA